MAVAGTEVVVRRWLIVAAAVGVPGGIFLLAWAPPGSGVPYPPCWLHALTGLHCPGCGATRCLAALTRGDVLQAAAYNPLLLLCLPYLLLWGVRAAVRTWRGQSVSSRELPGWAIAGIATVIVVYGILRNLPFAPFDLLAPHQL
jgi:hypothetical protein